MSGAVWLAFPGAFIAGFIDAVVGGGGLVQIPLLFTVLPGSPASAILGTNKLSSVFGTTAAALRYWRRVGLPPFVLPGACCAFGTAYLGAAAVARLSADVVKPVVLVLLLVVAVYTYVRKDLGRAGSIRDTIPPGRAGASAVGGALGFYDGFFGPGTGSFLIFIFVRYFALDFLQASAASKVINVATNLGALAYFLPQEGVLVALGLGMAGFNILGSVVGANLAVKFGAGFVRGFFLVVVSALLIKFATDLFV